MKKLLAVLMITGMFGFAACGNEQKSEENAATTDSSMMAPAEAAPAEAAPAAMDSTAAPAADSTVAQ